jgi:thymidine kinase
MGTITTITGPMFSGKTTELLRIKSREEVAKRHSFVFKPRLDNRYSDKEITNHNGIKEEAIVVESPSEILKNVEEYLSSGRYKEIPLINIFIDEVQFFTSDILEVIKEVSSKGINVFSCGLNQTFKGDPFPFKDNKEHIGTLMALSDYLIHLDAVCNNCGEAATKTYRLGDSKETVVLGGTETYQARCTKCFKKI